MTLKETISNELLAGRRDPPRLEDVFRKYRHSQIARSLGSSSPQVWQAMSRAVVQHLLVGIATWAKEKGGNVEIPPPAVVKQNALLPSWAMVTLSQLLLWSLTGVFTPEERRALATGR